MGERLERMQLMYSGTPDIRERGDFFYEHLMKNWAEDKKYPMVFIRIPLTGNYLTTLDEIADNHKKLGEEVFERAEAKLITWIKYSCEDYIEAVKKVNPKNLAKVEEKLNLLYQYVKK